MAGQDTIKRALLSVYDKTGIVEFARILAGYGVELISTGGTAQLLRESGLEILDVSEVTGFPEMLDGRVKTLHPKIHGGLLGRRDLDSHRHAMSTHGIIGIDLLVVTLYPFEETIRSQTADYAACIEKIDIGGPAMIRSAAKNHNAVTVVTAPEDYDSIAKELEDLQGAISLATRKACAAKAFARTAAYDAAIANWFAESSLVKSPVNSEEDKAIAPEGSHLPHVFYLGGALRQKLRYGENPHQRAGLYQNKLSLSFAPHGVADARQLQGKELSYNNLNDSDAALRLVMEFATPACVIVKHANPCGVAVAENLAQAVAKALAADPKSAFGGIVALNRPLDEDSAQILTGHFFEVIIAPAITETAQKIFAKKKNLRLLILSDMEKLVGGYWQAKTILGGVLVQESDMQPLDPSQLVTVTRKPADEEVMAELSFAWKIAKHTKSNAIVLSREGSNIGIGAGQMSRVDSVILALEKARQIDPSRIKGSVLASDAFFPFADGVELAAKAGIRAIIQPGGSMRDQEVIAAADEAGLIMVCTQGLRHFTH